MFRFEAPSSSSPCAALRTHRRKAGCDPQSFAETANSLESLRASHWHVRRLLLRGLGRLRIRASRRASFVHRRTGHLGWAPHVQQTRAAQFLFLFAFRFRFRARFSVVRSALRAGASITLLVTLFNGVGVTISCPKASGPRCAQLWTCLRVHRTRRWTPSSFRIPSSPGMPIRISNKWCVASCLPLGYSHRAAYRMNWLQNFALGLGNRVTLR